MIESAELVTGGALALLRQPDVHYGVRLGERLGAIVAERACTRVLPVVTGSLRRHPLVLKALASLGPAALPVFDGLKPHTPFEVVLALAAAIGRTKPDLILVIGGGSALDAAKIGTLAAAGGATDRESLLALRAVPDAGGTIRPSPVTRPMPILAVPTTLSAAEFGMIAGATDGVTGIKKPVQIGQPRAGHRAVRPLAGRRHAARPVAVHGGSGARSRHRDRPVARRQSLHRRARLARSVPAGRRASAFGRTGRRGGGAASRTAGHLAGGGGHRAHSPSGPAMGWGISWVRSPGCRMV